jgi:transposase
MSTGARRAEEARRHRRVAAQALETDARRPRKERRTALRLFAQLQAEGFAGSYSRVTEAIRAWRAEAGAVTARSAFVPLRFEWGEAFQFDWSEEGIVIGGVWRKVQLAHMKLCASRAFWLVAYPAQSHEMLFDAHLRCLIGLGGIARRGIYDNMKTAVDRVPGRGKARIVNARFAAMTAHYLFDPDFCNVASGWEKGRVEKGVQDARRRIWQSALEQRFVSFAELNVWLATQCVEARRAAHPDFPGMTHCRGAGARAAAPDADAGGVRWLHRITRAGVQHLPGVGGPQSLLGALRLGRAPGQRAAVSGARGDRRRSGDHRRAPRSTERDHVIYDWQHYVPLIAAQTRRAAQRRAVCRYAGAAEAPEPGAAAPRRRRSGDGAGAGRRATAWPRSAAGRG